jgi:hypothetical protein
VIDTCTDVYSTIHCAIEQQIPILATYDGHRRLLCPHALGTKRDRQQVLCYQAAGGSESGLSHPGASTNWRCLRLDKLSEVEFCPGPWLSGGNHSTPHT